MQITLEVPEELSGELQQYQGQLVEILELGLQNLTSKQNISTQNIITLSELLVNQLSPEQVLAMRPNQELKARVSKLLEGNVEGTLSSQEEAELDRYVALERVVSLAKARSAKNLKKQL